VGHGDRLDSWKEIAALLGVTVRTAQRWERLEGLPVHRQMHAKLGSAYGFGTEIHAWRAARRDPAAPTRTEPRVRTMAVLPFANLNRDLEGDVLADGITEELITALARVAGLRVVARTSAFYFKRTLADLREVGTALGADTLLEGSVRRQADRIRVSARLVEARKALEMWSDAFEARHDEAFVLQCNLAHAVTGALRARLRPAGSAAPPDGPPPTPATSAYGHYLEGLYHWNRRTPAGYLKAVERLELAVAEDPKLAPAWSALAGCYANATVTSTSKAAEARERGSRAARIALELDPGLAQAHVYLGAIAAVHAFDWAEAAARFRRALEISPGLVDAHFYYAAFVHAPHGRLALADEHQALAAQIDPLSAVVANGTAMLHLARHKYDEATIAFRRTLELDPEYPWAHRGLGVVQLLKGRYLDALEWFDHVEMPNLAGGLIGYCHARLGREHQAREQLRRLESSGHPSLSYQVAIIHLALGDLGATFEWLERACAERSLGAMWTLVDPIWDQVRGDERFAHVVAAMGLDPSAVIGRS